MLMQLHLFLCNCVQSANIDMCEILKDAIVSKSANSRCHFQGGETPAVQRNHPRHLNNISLATETVLAALTVQLKQGAEKRCGSESFDKSPVKSPSSRYLLFIPLLCRTATALVI